MARLRSGNVEAAHRFRWRAELENQDQPEQSSGPSRTRAGMTESQSIFRRSMQRFAAENATNAGNPEHDPILKKRIML
jgi:hypothetical protein